MPRKATASILHVHWRTRDDWATAHPRFAPGPRLQALGFKSRDLKHDDGTWYSFEEAEKFSRAVENEATSRQHQQQKPARLPAIARAHESRTLSQLCHDVFALPEFSGRTLVEGKRVRQALSAVTVKGYRYCATSVEAACLRMQEQARTRLSLWHTPAAALTTPLMQALLNEVESHSGLAKARAVRAFLSQMWTRLGRREPGTNRHLFDDLERMPSLPGRVTPWEPEQFWAMVEAADSMGLPAMADSFFWGAITGLRQTDRLRMTRASISDTHITITPSKTANKTAAVVQVKYAGLLRQRQEAAWARRAGWPVAWPHMLADEQHQRPWPEEATDYRHTFARVREQAVKRLPSCATLRDQDLRDTNQTWLDRANVDPELMQLAAGHSFNRHMSQIQKRHYVAQNQPRLDAATDLLTAYLLKHMPTHPTVIPAKAGNQLQQENEG